MDTYVRKKFRSNQQLWMKSLWTKLEQWLTFCKLHMVSFEFFNRTKLWRYAWPKTRRGIEEGWFILFHFLDVEEQIE